MQEACWLLANTCPLVFKLKGLFQIIIIFIVLSIVPDRELTS